MSQALNSLNSLPTLVFVCERQTYLEYQRKQSKSLRHCLFFFVLALLRITLTRQVSHKHTPHGEGNTTICRWPHFFTQINSFCSFYQLFAFL